MPFFIVFSWVGGFKRRQMLLFLCLFLGFSLLCSENVGADVYRWVDSDGRVHYTDQLSSGAVMRVDIDPPDRQSDRQADQQRLKENARWFSAQQKQRKSREAIRIRAAKKRSALAAKAADKCQRQRDALEDKDAELDSKKRQGIRPAEERKYDIKIEQLERKVERACG